MEQSAAVAQRSGRGRLNFTPERATIVNDRKLHELKLIKPAENCPLLVDSVSIDTYTFFADRRGEIEAPSLREHALKLSTRCL